ncbi:MAG TPA: potassium channel family protein [Candidatus Baltobacteraceae bacterium]|jgi:hypothetical protein|nr:potassium channel family protein [Candidatus Baltobacteraceae bacterium]
MQAAWNSIVLIAGIVSIVLMLSDVFQSVIVPRAVGRRLRFSYLEWRLGWLVWPKLSRLFYPDDGDARENFLALFAPLALVLMLVLWALVAILGFGCVFWAFRTHIHPVPTTFWEAVYFAGTSFVTVGFGDFVGTTGITRMVSVLAGACGFGVVSVTTAYLFAIFGFFQAREAFVVTIGARAGLPPSGVGLLAVAKYANIESDLAIVMRDGQAWTAMLMESHLAYPTLAYFRSSHDDESWVGTLGTLLDAAALMMTALREPTGQAQIMYNIGRHATHDLARYFAVPHIACGAGVSQAEFARACDRLRSAGLSVRDAQASWHEFSALRATYAGNLRALAQYLSVPPVLWVSDRALLEPHHSESVSGVELM